MAIPLYLVYGGVLKNVEAPNEEFENPNEIHVVGLFADREDAVRAWRGEAQRTVDSAQTRYFVKPI